MRIGAKKRPFYRVVAVDERKKRTGSYLENLGTYNPLTEPKEIILKQDRIDLWLKQGAVMSDGFLRIIKQAPQRPPRKPKKEKEEKPEVQIKPEEQKTGESEDQKEETTEAPTEEQVVEETTPPEDEIKNEIEEAPAQEEPKEETETKE